MNGLLGGSVNLMAIIYLAYSLLRTKFNIDEDTILKGYVEARINISEWINIIKYIIFFLNNKYKIFI